jgi:hypothetical protein
VRSGTKKCAALARVCFVRLDRKSLVEAHFCFESDASMSDKNDEEVKRFGNH